MKIIGITGSSGSGKSTICEILKKKYNVKIINADVVAKELMKNGTEYYEDVVKKFGTQILDTLCEIDRKKLSNLIYNNSEQREKLNNSTFYYVVKEIEERIKKEKSADFLIIDAALLFESKLNNICDITIGVITDRNLQVERIIKRDNITEELAMKRLKSQQTNFFFKEKCTEIILNNVKIEELEKQIVKLAEKYNVTERLQ